MRRREPEQARVPPGCAAALLQEALTWLQPQSLHGLLDFALTAASPDASSHTISSTAQAAFLALAAALDIVRACSQLDMVNIPGRSLMSALHRVQLLHVPISAAV